MAGGCTRTEPLRVVSRASKSGILHLCVGASTFYYEYLSKFDKFLLISHYSTLSASALYDIPANCCRHALIRALSNCITALSFGLLDFHRSAVGTAGFSTSYGTLLLLLYPSLVVLHSNR